MGRFTLLMLSFKKDLSISVSEIVNLYLGVFLGKFAYSMDPDDSTLTFRL